MDFAKLKKKALELKDQAVEKSKDAVSYGAGKLGESALTLKDKKALDDFIASSKNTISKTDDGKQKTHTKRVIVIFADTQGDFFKKMLYMLPVLATKAFSQNVSLKLADANMKGFDKKTYDIQELPTLVVFENTTKIKSLSGEEPVQKVVKTASLDINTTIDSM